MIKKSKITIVGCGYVGMSLSVLLAKENDVTVLEIDEKKVDRINEKKSTVEDKDIEDYLKSETLFLKSTTCKEKAYRSAEFIVIATPTNYNQKTNYFDTSHVDNVVADAIHYNSNALIVIKSTIPVGHTKKLQKINKSNHIIHSPEFLREGKALHDNLYPSRIIIGGKSSLCNGFADIMKKASKKENVSTLFVSSSEAEAIKLFSNTFLAMRVSYFNELDSFALVNNMNTKNIIEGVCLDERIGDTYNNPSFGYGGYCLPKDTKQLLANYESIPQSLVQAIVNSNDTRKDFIANEVIKEKPNSVGFYRLIMKEGSDNFRESAIFGIIKRIKEKGIKVQIYEPSIFDSEFNGNVVISSFKEFTSSSDIILTNRFSKELEPYKDKVFSRDIYGEN